MTDRQLLAEYAESGSQKAFTAIVERHSAKVFSACLRVLGNRHAAEDAAQATFLVLARKGRRLSPRTVLSGWLFLAARTTALQMKRSAARRARHEREAAAMREREKKKEAAVWNAVRPWIDGLLASLPAAQRDALVLCYLDGRSRAQAAAELGCPEKTLDTRLTRALRRLRGRLGGRAGRLSAAALGGLLAGSAVEAVPPGLTASISSACAGGGAAASAGAQAAAQAAVKAMTFAKLKVATVVLSAAAVAGGGGAMAVRELTALHPAPVKLPVSLTLKEHGGAARPAWPVTGGVPLPRGAVKDAGELELKDAGGKAVPCQFNTVTRWPDGSLKWVHLSFQADLPAGGELGYTLGKGQPAPVARPIKVTEGAGAITIDTGAARIVVSRKRGSIIESLEVGGEKLLGGAGMSLTGAAYVSKVTRPTYRHSKYTNMPISKPRATARCGTETWTARPADAESVELVGSVTGPDGRCPRKFKGHWTSKSGRIILYPNYQWGSWGFGDLSDKTYWTFETEGGLSGKTLSTLFGKVESAAVEKKGPLLACIYLVGTFSTEDGKPFIPAGKDKQGQPYADPSGDFFKYRVRLYAYAGKPYVYLVPAITHAGPMDATPPAWFRKLGLHLQVPALAGGAELTLGGAAGKLGKEARLVQLLGEDPLARSVRERNRRKLSFSVSFDGAEKAGGEKAVGSLTAGGLGLAVRRFWEYGPKGISVRPGEVRVELWPERADGVAYSLCMGRQRSHELLLGAAGRAELAAFRAPRPVAVAPGSWYAGCEVFGMLAEERDYAEAYPKSQVEALERNERLQKCVVDPQQAIKRGKNPPACVLTQFIPGWQDYGDLPWAEDWSNLHYDWTMSMLLHFLRTGKREFFEAADAMAWHRKDIAQNHCGQCGRGSVYKRWSNHLTYYEKDDHRTVGQGPKPSHTWNRGIGYWYLLTGDPMAREVAVRTAEGLRGFYAPLVEGKAKMEDPGAELRMYGWTIENFLGAYEVTGERKYLDWALGLCRSSFGAIRAGGKVEKAAKMHPLMFGYSFEPICRLHHYTGDGEVLATLRYMVDEALLARFLKLGRKVDGGYLPTAAPYGWNRKDWEAGKLRGWQTPWNFFWPNPLAYLYMQTGEGKYLKLARQIFREAAFYYAEPYKPLDPGGRSNLAYFDGMFAGSSTKIHGWAGRYNLIYLYMEKQLARGARFPRK